MPTTADQRLLELLGKWLTSLELHAKYCTLDEASYASLQAWPKHQRPSRWIIDLAREKALALKTQVEERIRRGDAQFSESLELMVFLANLVGAEHIERFIPLAERTKEGTPAPSPVPVLAPAQARAKSTDPLPPPADAAATGTREMPQFAGGLGQPRTPAASPTVVRTPRRAEAATSANAAPPAQNAGGRKDGFAPSDEVCEQVIADAARLVQWGRKWYELAELISSMADRPHLTDVRRILKDNKSLIDERAGRN
jgi:hypothetical protein